MFSRLLRWTILIVGLSALAISATLTLARQHPPEPLLLYHAADQDAYVARLNGQPLAQLADAGIKAIRPPVWSPHGNQTAFVGASHNDSRTNLYVMDVLGHHVQPVTYADETRNQQSLVWSPDGAWLAYVHSGEQRRQHVRLVSPDGLRTAVYLQSPQGGFWRIELGSLRWSQDGHRLSMVVTPEPDAPLHLAFLDLHSGHYELHQLPFSRISTPEWSPDGAWLAFAVNSRRVDSASIYRMNVTDMTHEQLAGDLGSIVAGSSQPVLDWSLDNHQILFAAKYGHLNSIFLLDVDGGETVRISNYTSDDKSPVWSPDGKWIYFTSLRDETRGIYRMRPDGTNVKKIVDTGNDEFYPGIGMTQTRSMHVWLLSGFAMITLLIGLGLISFPNRTLYQTGKG